MIGAAVAAGVVNGSTVEAHELEKVETALALDPGSGLAAHHSTRCLLMKVLRACGHVQVEEDREG